MGEAAIMEAPVSHKPTARILIEVYVSSRNAGPIELVLQRCCLKTGDLLLARDQFRDRQSTRYTVLLAHPERERLSAHMHLLLAALQEGLLGFACKYVPLLVEVRLPAPPATNTLSNFPLKEQGSECYTAFHCPQTFYVTRPQDYLLAPEHLTWIQCHDAHYRIF